MAMRTDLLNSIREIDAEIDKAINNRRSKRSFERAKELFAERSRIVKELAEFGLHIEQHPAVTAHLNKDQLGE